MMSDKVPIKTHCVESSIWAGEAKKTFDNCTATFDSSTFSQRIKNKCHGKETCAVDITGLQPSTASSECGNDAFVYVQLPCEIETDQAKQRMIFGLITGCVTVFVYLYTLVYFDYIKCVETNKYVDWDVKTITAGDYTIEFDLDPETYDHWKEHYYDETNLLSESAQFKLYIQTELESMCTAIENQGFDTDVNEIKIAQITMAYNNSKIINRLTERGLLIKKEEWAKLAEKNQQILEEIQSEPVKEGEPSLLDQLQRPVSVFATFENEEGYQRACAYENYAQRAICGQKFELQEASEPSDIIWENRHFTPRQRTKKRCIIYFIIVILLCISGAIIFFATNYSLKLKFKYPAVKCSTFDVDYNVNSETQTIS